MNTLPSPSPRLHHPGPRGEPRIQACDSRVIGRMEALRPGASLAAELVRMTDELGVSSSFAEIFSGELHSLSFCVPAAGDGEREVSYSPTRRLDRAYLLYGSATIGVRRGEPFVHAHLHWLDEAGGRGGGHAWPETLVGGVSPVAAVYGLLDASWHSIDDPETLMPTFEPRETDSGAREARPTVYHADGRTTESEVADMSDASSEALVARVLPNEDIGEAAVRLCRDSGFTRAVVRAGVGSLIGAEFTDHRTGGTRHVDGPGTEVISLTGFIEQVGGVLLPRLTCTLVDRHGEVHTGVLVPGRNPVAVTFELTIQPVA